MANSSKFVVTCLFLIISVITPTPLKTEHTGKKTAQPSLLTPANTVIVSNKFDERFSKDFSVLLKHLRLEWVVLESSEVPDSIRSNNLIFLGHPDSNYIGQIIREILTREEIEALQNTEKNYTIFEKESPWAENRTIFICSGVDFLNRRNAAEDLIRTMISQMPPASDWIRTAYDVDLDEKIHAEMIKLQYRLPDQELPIQDLLIDVNAKSPRKITSQEAMDDVDHLIYLFSHGYSGYAFFNQNNEFELARKVILEELSSRASWSSKAFAELLHEHFSFIFDSHLSIGEYKFAEHIDFWYAVDFDLTLNEDGYQFEVDRKIFTIESINDVDPAPFLLPSLNRQGEPIYRLGLLSAEKPLPLTLTASSNDGPHQFSVELKNSDFDHYAMDVFREDVIAGIPVLRVRGFGDSAPDELTRFVETGENLRGQPVVIVDVRGNSGGNERWPSLWIQGLTGAYPTSIFVFSELESKTSMIGRANAFNYWAQQGSDPSLFSADAEKYTKIAESIESSLRQPQWTGPSYPHIPLISNDTTVIIITNNPVASAGEGFVMRMSQAENVVVVGENTKGALTFGNISVHQLPNSKLMVWLPINLNLFPDGNSREGTGLVPDLWVPAADAVNYAVAAVRYGTITTFQPVSGEILETDFIPESPIQKILNMGLEFWVILVGFAGGGMIWAYFMRKRPGIMLSIGLIWFIFAWYFVSSKSSNPIGYGFLIISITYIIWGGVIMIKKKKRRQRFLKN